MNAFDIAIVGILTLFVFLGARRGFIEEILGLSGWIISVICMIKFTGFLAAFITNQFPQVKVLSPVLAALVILFGVRYSFILVMHMMKKSTPEITENNFNKMGGALLGFLQGALLISFLVIIMLVIPFGKNVKKVQNESALFPHLGKVSVYIVKSAANFFPPGKEAAQKLLNKMEGVDIKIDGLKPEDMNGLPENIKKEITKASAQIPDNPVSKETQKEIQNKVEQMDKELRR